MAPSGASTSIAASPAQTDETEIGDAAPNAERT